MKKILCCGEALIDMLPIEDDGEMGLIQPVCGGSVFNSARALARLGSRVGFFSPLSNDFFGRTLLTVLAREGVETELCPILTKPSTLAFVRLTNGQAEYCFFDNGSALQSFREGLLPKIPFDSIEALFFGGISLSAEPSGTGFEKMFFAAPKHMPIMLDPNIRPDFIANEASFRARLERMFRRATIIKVSDQDLQWISGHENLIDAGKDILAKGPKLLCITRGENGVIVMNASGQTLDVPATQVEAVDTIGAGDTFNAGLLSGLSQAGLLHLGKLGSSPLQDMEPAIKLGVEAAAYTVQQKGANPPFKHDLKQTGEAAQ